MIIKMMEVGPLMANCYILGERETGEAAVFDPGGDADKILEVLDQDGLRLRYILNTHSHFDHIGGNRALQEATGAPILCHPEEAPGLRTASAMASMCRSRAEDSEATGFLEEGDQVEVGSIRIDVLDLRGHSRAGLGFLFDGEIETDGKVREVKMVICGDALFAGAIGATDHPEGNLPLLLANIRSRVFSLPEETLILPGHGPVSTVGREKRLNPFFQANG